MPRVSNRLKNKVSSETLQTNAVKQSLKNSRKMSPRVSKTTKNLECHPQPSGFQENCTLENMVAVKEESDLSKDEIDESFPDHIEIKQEVTEDEPGCASNDFSVDEMNGEETSHHGTEVFEVVKSEMNIKYENESTNQNDSLEDISNNELSGYEHLLENITVERSSRNEASEGGHISDESNSEEDPDDPDDPNVVTNDETDDETGDDDDDDDDYDYGHDNPGPVKKSSATRKVNFSFYFCSQCDFKCRAKGELTKHMVSHEGKHIFRCQFCGDVFKSKPFLDKHCTFVHSDSLKDSTLTELCKFCLRGFKTKLSLFDHIKSHSGEKPYECNKCSKKFIRKGGLNQHLHHHLGFRPFKCNFCHLAFKTKGNKDSHMKRHLGVKEFKCDECGKDFIRKDQLKKHVLCVHYKKCMYRCSICNKSFKGHVLSHLRIHMNEKQFKCKECGKSFVQSSQLNVHMRTHTGAKPYQCEVCKVRFSHSSAVRVHMRTHTGEKPVKCQLCPAAFSQLPHLKKHMRCVHKCDKPYVCVPCHKFFQTKSELGDHLSAKNCKNTSTAKSEKTKGKK